MSAPPATLGPYRIDRELGRGGMGVVYLGHDTRLDRWVAIKALPSDLSADPDRLARFEREARTLASLAHPNIVGVYGLEEAGGQRYLVLEYVQGETLAARIARGPVPVTEALDLASRIALALEAAHEKGIVHRDLKPANVMVTAEGEVKVLDFGLARSTAAPPSSAPDAPTELSPGALPSPTVHGVVMGSAGYMSPEQARGKPVDRRSDIFSFGCVLFELLTGTRPFAGETMSDAIGAVLHTNADFSRLPHGTPPHIRRVLERCLERDKAARYRDIGDVHLDLQSGGADVAVVPANGRGRRFSGAVLAAFAAGVLLGAAALWSLPGPPADTGAGPKRFGLSGVTMPVDAYLGIAISPSGSHIAMRGLDEAGDPQLYLRALDSVDVVPVPESAAGWLPFFSPDGRELAFVAQGQLRVAPVAGGAARTIGTVPGGFFGGVWASRDSIVYSGPTEPVLYRMSSSGGPVEKIPLVSEEKFDVVVVTSALPGDAAVLGVVRRGERISMAIISLADGSVRLIEGNGFQPTYSPSGHVLYQQDTNGPLMALPFDARRGAATGRPFLVATNIGSRVSFQTRTFAVSDDGTLVFVPPDVTQQAGTLVWVDRLGRRETILRLDHYPDLPRLSHDGSRLAFRAAAPNCDIWVYDIARGTSTRLTTEGDNHGIVWSAAGDQVATVRLSAAARGRALWLRSDGAGVRRPLYPDDIEATFMAAVSRDQQYAFFTEQREGSSRDVRLIDVGARKVTPLLNSRFDESGVALSPNGQLLAYVSNESGRNEIYLQPFPTLDNRVAVSSGGGAEPVWSRDGRTLFYRRGNAVLMVAAPAGPGGVVGRPVQLFEGAFVPGPSGLAGFDVAPDGQRFVMVQRDTSGSSGGTVEVVVNWFAELARLQEAVVGQ